MENTHICTMGNWTTDIDWYTIEMINDGISSRKELFLDLKSRNRVNKCAEYLASIIEKNESPVYGVNTGFGSLCDVSIPSSEVEQLQCNLIRSHACGVGEKVPKEIVRIILLLKIISLKQGYSGVKEATLDKLISFYNDNILPVIYELGSLGASGDLAPLAHMALPLIGEGEVYTKQGIKSAGMAIQNTIQLGPKEGLALINGTQFSTAHATWAMIQSERLMEWAIKIAALSMDVFGCRRTPFDHKIHEIRRQIGQKNVAERILSLLEGSGMKGISGSIVQDPYSFRCIPQVLGATLDAMKYSKEIIEREINAVTDNPNVFYEDKEVLEGGNFHAQPIALICDHLAIAMAELASISERRIFLLISGNRNLPDYLTSKPGVQSGMMIVQYTAASVVSQNKQLCTPASIDSIVSSKGQEDHVSMAANASTKLRRVIENVERVLAMELFVAMQALDFRRPLRSSQSIESMYTDYRKHISFAEEDRIFYKDIEKSIQFLRR